MEAQIKTLFVGLFVFITIIANVFATPALPEPTTTTKAPPEPTTTTTAPPEPDNAALMGRYIINKVNWVSIATESTLKNISGYPFANLKSVSDGPIDQGSGVPYMLLTNLDLSGRDIMVNPKVTIMATLAETEYCSGKGWDLQDPRCGRLIITGKIKKLQKRSKEYLYAKKTLFERHPAMKGWVLVHDFYIGKVDIEHIAVLDYFGGAKFVNVYDYFHPKRNTIKYQFTNSS